MKKYMQVFKISTEDLPRATIAMNYYCNFFESKVTSVDIQGKIGYVAVEFKGSYPFITNQWDFIIE